jgi:EAL domain-containing protein (putative c-di-GMP-specific phosphodiesterase class I)
VSSVQLTRPDLLASVEAALRDSGLPPRRLQIEITESVFTDQASQALGSLLRLKQLGSRIALDDFGSGTSSLGTLRRFPFDTLKIDAGLVAELSQRGDAAAIVRSLIELAGTLGMHTVAGGVEDASQMQVLREAGCAAMQGPLAARPMPIGELATLLTRRQGPDGQAGGVQS